MGAGVKLPGQQLLPEVIARLIRMTGGSLRLLTRLLTQIERVLSVNNLQLVPNAAAEAPAKASLSPRMTQTTQNDSETLRQIATKAIHNQCCLSSFSLSFDQWAAGNAPE